MVTDIYSYIYIFPGSFPRFCLFIDAAAAAAVDVRTGPRCVLRLCVALSVFLGNRHAWGRSVDRLIDRFFFFLCQVRRACRRAGLRCTRGRRHGRHTLPNAGPSLPVRFYCRCR